MSGKIRKYATITPSKAILKGTVGEKITRIITVVPDAQNPFKIVNISTLHGTDFRYSMKETKIDGKKAYEFLIENTRTSPGRYMDRIDIQTDKPGHNPVTIIVKGDIKPVGPVNQAAPAQGQKKFYIK